MKHPILIFGALLIVSTLCLGQEYKTYDEGVAKFKAKEYNTVIDLFSGILNDPKHSKRLDEDLYFYRGQSYYHVNEYDKALADLDQALALNHYNQGTIYWYKARCFDKQGKVKDAESFYEQAVAASEKNKKVNAMILADRSQFYQRQGNREKAQQDLALAKTLDPGNTTLAKSEVAVNKESPSRTAKEEKKTTQVYVRNNPPAEQKQKPADNNPSQKQTPPVDTAPAEQTSTSKASLIPALSEAYKDEKRYALVIGNSNYAKEIGILKNPVNDATDVATELRKSNFEVQLLTNATYVQIREAMRKFQEKLTDGPKDQTVGLFYYAGHGVQFQDENYLVPVDANVKYEDDIVRMCFPVQRMVLANMERSNSRMNIVILDACRNNPFPASTRSVSQGLAEMKRARGSFIAYATAPGSVASDGSGRNGLYTQELLKALRKPGLTIEQVFKEVRVNVLRLSGDKQFTWDSSNIIGEFYFKF
jgi:tetratricopeptide (TPR) repeat protein